MYVWTRLIIRGGIDSIIRLKLYDAYDYYIYITNLEAEDRLMDLGHIYFEQGNLDIFRGKGPYLD
ncbi:hypothetical protein E2542_SST20720 [Spatholobus suberectus]|nr:hypothetical protein E2542_SST20720 [Spatholobus suberectus]